jgi:putative transposase
MSHSYTSLAYHIVFATKYRSPYLTPKLRKHLFPYMADAIRRLGGRHIITNGPDDHVHQLCILMPDITVAEVVQKVKSYSSGWVHRNFPELERFAWQIGYAAFTVGPKEIGRIERYISRQQEHHGKQQLKDELAQMFSEHDIQFDEQAPFE